MEKKTAQVGIRVTPEFKERLEAQAHRERRKVSNMIYNVLCDYLEATEPKNDQEQK